MKNLSRGAWVAIAAVVGIPAGVAIAKTMDQAGWNRPSPETRARLSEGRIAMAKAALKLTPEQEKLFAPIETQTREAFKAREAKRAEWDKKREDRGKDSAETDKSKRPDMGERIEKMSANMTERAERMKAFATSFKPFYASLSDEQKDVLRPLMRDFAPGFGKGGHRGPRWAMNGWGPGGGPDGHRGWSGGGRHHDRGEGRGGPATDDAGPGPQPGPDDAQPEAPPAK